MVDGKWDLAIAKLCFLESYLRDIKLEVIMKNREMFQREQRSEAPARKAEAPLPGPRPAWPLHRRFWHRSPRPREQRPRPQNDSSPQAAGDDADLIPVEAGTES